MYKTVVYICVNGDM